MPFGRELSVPVSTAAEAVSQWQRFGALKKAGPFLVKLVSWASASFTGATPGPVCLKDTVIYLRAAATLFFLISLTLSQVTLRNPAQLLERYYLINDSKDLLLIEESLKIASEHGCSEKH